MVTLIKRNATIFIKFPPLTLTTNPVCLYEYTKESVLALLIINNNTLGKFKFELSGVPPGPAPRGVPQVEVTFGIAANGISNVSASLDKTTRNRKGQPHHDYH